MEVGGGAVVGEGRAPAAGLVAGGRLDLDHVGAEVGEGLADPGTREHPRELEHPEPRQRCLGHPPPPFPVCPAGRLRCGPGLGRELAREAGVDQGDRLGDAVERDEAAEARALLLAEEHLVDRGEPVAERLEAVVVADGEDEVLQRLGIGGAVPGLQPVAQVGEGGGLLRVGGAVGLGRRTKSSK